MFAGCGDFNDYNHRMRSLLCLVLFVTAGCAPTPDAKHPLAKRLLDPFTSNQVTAKEALHAMPVAERRVLLADLIRGTTHSDQYIRINAVVALAELGPEYASDTTPTLRARLNDSEDSVRIWAGMALARLGDKGGEATVGIVTKRLLNPPDASARTLLPSPVSWAASGVRPLDLSSTIEPLTNLARDSANSIEVSQALNALVSLRAAGALLVIDALAARSPDPLIRSHAANAAREFRREQ